MAERIPSRDITPEAVYLRRREIMRGGAAFALAAATGLGRRALADEALPPIKKGPFSTGEAQTPFKDVTTYNNFYELGTAKDDPAKYAGALQTRPWTISFEGEIAK